MMWVDTAVVHAPEMLEVVWAGELFNDTSNVRLGRRSRRQWPDPLKPLPRSSSAQTTRELTFDRAVVVLDTSQWMLIRGADTLGGLDFGMRNAADGILSRNLQLEHEEADGSDYDSNGISRSTEKPHWCPTAGYTGMEMECSCLGLLWRVERRLVEFARNGVVHHAIQEASRRCEFRAAVTRHWFFRVWFRGRTIWDLSGTLMAMVPGKWEIFVHWKCLSRIFILKKHPPFDPTGWWNGFGIFQN